MKFIMQLRPSHRRLLPLKLSFLLILSAGILLISGCSPDGGGSTPSPDPTGTGIVQPTATASPQPTPTLTPLPPRALLIAPTETDAWIAAEINQTMQELTADSGLVFETKPDLSSQDLTSDTKLVVALPGISGLDGLASANPDTHFIAIGYTGLEPGANLSIIGPEGFRPDQQGFVAGNLAAMQTEDWRVGVVSVGDTIDGQAGRNGFLNGAVFFCGLCRPAFPPFVLYPTFSDVPSAADEGAWQAAAQALLGEGVQTVYLYPGADNPGLRQRLIAAGFILIVGPAGEPGIQPEVIARIVPNPSSGIELLWPEALKGAQGQVLPMPIAVQDINPNLISEGRISQLKNTIDDLMNGITDTGIDPLTAEAR